MLGAVAARRSHAVVDLGGPRRRRLLAHLALHVGRPVTSERLVEAIWGDHPPASAPGTLHNHLAALRRDLEPFRAPGEPSSVIVSTPGGFMLDLEPSMIDAWEFEYLVARAGAAVAAPTPWSRHEHHDSATLLDAVGCLDRALGLWSGTPFADLENHREAVLARTRLDLAAQTAHRLRWSLLGAVGRGSEALGAVAEEAAIHPDDEHLHGLLAVLQVWAGRPAEALGTLRALRTRLVDDHGLGLSAPLTTLLDDVLHERLAPPRAAPVAIGSTGSRTAPPADSEPADHGRSNELDLLLGAWARTVSGTTTLGVIAGDPGSGKTWLAEALAARLPADTPIVRARASRHPLAPSWWAMRQVVEALDLPEPAWDGEPFTVAHRLVSDLQRTARERGPVLVILDDLQWSDLPTLLALRLLAESAGRDSLLVLLLWRPGCSGPEIGAVAEAVSSAQAVRIRVGALPQAAVRSLAEEVLGTPPSEEEMRHLLERTDGNPLFVLEYCRLARLRGGLGSVFGTGTPPEILDLVQPWAQQLPAETLTALRSLAPGGRVVDPTEAAGRLGVTEEEVRSLLEPAVRIGFLYPAPENTLRFAHRVFWDSASAPRSLALSPQG